MPAHACEYIRTNVRPCDAADGSPGEEFLFSQFAVSMCDLYTGRENI